MCTPEVRIAPIFVPAEDAAVRGADVRVGYNRAIDGAMHATRMYTIRQ